MTRKISAINHKGGCGKTTTAVNLAAALAVSKKRVLLIDLDPQCHTSEYVDVRESPEVSRFTSAELLQALPTERFEPIKNHLVDGLDFIPGTLRLGMLEPSIPQTSDGMRRLARSLAPHEAQYDFILIDCPPSLGLLSQNAMFACPEILIPVELTPFNVSGMLKLYDFIQAFRHQADLRVLGILGTRFLETASLPKKLIGDLREAFPNIVFNTYIHQNQALPASVVINRPLVLSKPADRGSREHFALAEEVIARG